MSHDKSEFQVHKSFFTLWHFAIRYKYFFVWLMLYSMFFVVGQYVSVVPVSLEWLFGSGWWIPLHIITVIPLVDVCRAFSQYFGELYGMKFKTIFLSIMIFSFTISLLFCFRGNLPINICLAAFASVNLGGGVGILVFQILRPCKLAPFIRVSLSNLFATMTGGALFFLIAYTRVLEIVFVQIGYNFTNQNIMGNLIEGWIMQTLFIWIIGTLLAYLIDYMINNYQKIIFNKD